MTMMLVMMIMMMMMTSRPGGVTYLAQDQDSMGGDFNPRQSWSGEITQFNVWDFPLEEWMVENAAECRLVVGQQQTCSRCLTRPQISILELETKVHPKIRNNGEGPY